MLTIEALEAALPLTEQLVNRSLSLQPIPNSPLEALFKEAVPAASPVISPNAEAGFPLSDLMYSILSASESSDPVTLVKPHSVVTDEIVGPLAAAVKNHVAHARTVVIPLVEELVQKTKEQIQAINPSSLLGMQVVMYSPPAPFLNSVFEASLRKYDTTSYDPAFSVKFSLPERSVEELKQLLATGSNGVDKDVQSWLAEKGDDWLAQLWQQFFVTREATTLHAFVTDAKAVGRAAADIDKLLAIHLFARNLYDNPPEGVAVSLKLFNQDMAELRNNSAVRLFLENEAYYADTEKRQLLIRSINGTVITVYATPYKTWLEAGGENEVLFGNYLSRQPVKTVAELDARRDELRSAWAKHVAIVTTAEANRRFLRVKEILMRVFREQVIQAEEVNLNKEAVLKRFEDEVNCLAESDLDNLFVLCTKLVCRTRFAHTDAEKILFGIDRVAKENPTLTVREAAAISVLEYIASWVASQFKLV